MGLVFHTIIPIQSKLTYFPDACCVFHQYFQPTHLLFIAIPNQCKHFQMTRVLKVFVLLSGFYISEINLYNFEGYHRMILGIGIIIVFYSNFAFYHFIESSPISKKVMHYQLCKNISIKR